ncbi:hypothetical protein V8E36_001001 [Tilletia maclaganii]
MRTRRGPTGPAPTAAAAGASKTTRSTSKRVTASSTTTKKSTTAAAPVPAPTPAKPTRSRSTSGRTPLAVKNALSSGPSSSGGGGNALSSDLIPFQPTGEAQEKDEDESAKHKTKSTGKTKSTATATARPSLADLVDEALRPATQAPKRVNSQGTSSTRQPSTSSAISSKQKATSVADLLANKKAERTKFKKTVGSAGFYAQAAPAPPPLRKTASSSTTASQSARPVKANAIIPDREELSPRRPTQSSKLRKPLQPIPADAVPTAQSKANQASSSRHTPSYLLGSSRPAVGQRRTGMVVWDDEEDGKGKNTAKDHHYEDEDDDSSDDGDGKDAVVSEHGSSDKENRDPLAAGQTSASRTAVDAHRTLIPPEIAIEDDSPPRPARAAMLSKGKRPLEILEDVGPSHSTPLSGGRTKDVIASTKTGSALKHSAKTAARANASQSSSSGPSLLVPAQSQELSSSIPASDDVFLYAKPKDHMFGTSPSSKAADEPSLLGYGGAAPNDQATQLPDFGDHGPSNAEFPDFIDWTGEDGVEAPAAAHQVEDAAGAPKQTDNGEDEPFDCSSESAFPPDAQQHGAAGASFDEENDPFGFFAAELKLKARREKAAARRPEANQAELEIPAEDREEGAAQGQEVYGLNLRTEERAFASPSAMSSDDEVESAIDKARRKTAPAEQHGTAEAEEELDVEAELPETSTASATTADDCTSLLRRSHRTREKKKPIVELSDSESDAAPATEPAPSAKDRSSSVDYDTDRAPPGFSDVASRGPRRRGGGGAARSAAEDAEPFDSDDERPSRSTSDSSTSMTGLKPRTKGKGKGKDKAGADESQELELSELIKLLPKRAKGTTYGNKGKSRALPSASSSSKSIARTVSASKSKARRQPEKRQRTVSPSPSAGSSSLPSPAQVLRTTRKRRRAEDEEADSDEEANFSVLSSDAEDGATSREKKKSKKGAAKAPVPVRVTAGRVRGKKADVLPAWTREDVGSKSRSASAAGKGRKRGREESDKEDDVGQSGEEADSGDSEVEEVRPKAAQKKRTASATHGKAKKGGKQGSSTARTATTAKAVKKRVKAADPRPKDDVDDFELDTEFVI